MHTHLSFQKRAICLVSLRCRWKLTTRWQKQGAFDRFSSSRNITDLELCDKIHTLFQVHTLRVLFPENSSLVTKVGSLSKKVSLWASFWISVKWVSFIFGRINFPLANTRPCLSRNSVSCLRLAAPRFSLSCLTRSNQESPPSPVFLLNRTSLALTGNVLHR